MVTEQLRCLLVEDCRQRVNGPAPGLTALDVLVVSLADEIERVKREHVPDWYKLQAEAACSDGVEAVLRASKLGDAIGRIWRAPVYADRKRENGVSLELISAIYRAAAEAGYAAERDTPLAPEMERVSDELLRLDNQAIRPATDPMAS